LIVITNDYRSRGYSLAPKISPILGGRRYGLWLGILAALSLPYTSVRPGVWKRSIGLSGKDKEQARARAIQLFPGADLRRKRAEGRAEALLIAW